jgi:hypothetical protein
MMAKGPSAEEVAERAAALTAAEIAELVDRLSSKDDEVRFFAFRVLRRRSVIAPDVYPYWERFSERLASDNSYQRSIGAMLLAANVRWDAERRFDAVVDALAALFEDEKFVTARQAIQTVPEWIGFRPDLGEVVGAGLERIDLSTRKESQRGLLARDIAAAQAAIESVAG